MLPLLAPPLHGEVGFWDEIVCLIPSLFLIGLVIYMAVVGRRRGAKAEDAGDPAQVDPNNLE